MRRKRYVSESAPPQARARRVLRTGFVSKVRPNAETQARSSTSRGQDEARDHVKAHELRSSRGIEGHGRRRKIAEGRTGDRTWGDQKEQKNFVKTVGYVPLTFRRIALSSERWKIPQNVEIPSITRRREGQRDVEEEWVQNKTRETAFAWRDQGLGGGRKWAATKKKRGGRATMVVHVPVALEAHLWGCNKSE